MLSREQMSDLLWHHKFGRACNGPKLAAEGGLDSTQVKLNAESEHVIKRHCKRPAATPFDAFESLFDLNRLVSSRPRACTNGHLCPALHVDMHLGTLRLNRNCTAPKPFTCDDLLGLLFDTPQPPFALLNGPTLCLGALNDWFYTSPGRPATEGTILRRCEQSHPLAMELDRFGLPLRPHIAQAATSFFKEECDGASMCAYLMIVRRPKHWQRRYVYAMLGLRLLPTNQYMWSSYQTAGQSTRARRRLPACYEARRCCRTMTLPHRISPRGSTCHCRMA